MDQPDFDKGPGPCVYGCGMQQDRALHVPICLRWRLPGC